MLQQFSQMQYQSDCSIPFVACQIHPHFSWPQFMDAKSLSTVLPTSPGFWFDWIQTRKSTFIHLRLISLCTWSINSNICKVLGILVHCYGHWATSLFPCCSLISEQILLIPVWHNESDLGFGCHGPLRIRDVPLQRLPWRPAWYGIPASPRSLWTSTSDTKWCNQSGLPARECKEFVFEMTSWHANLISKLLDLCEGNPLSTNRFPSQRASYVEYVSR